MGPIEQRIMQERLSPQDVYVIESSPEQPPPPRKRKIAPPKIVPIKKKLMHFPHQAPSEWKREKEWAQRRREQFFASPTQRKILFPTRVKKKQTPYHILRRSPSPSVDFDSPGPSRATLLREAQLRRATPPPLDQSAIWKEMTKLTRSPHSTPHKRPGPSRR